jgi:hypothetical protein
MHDQLQRQLGGKPPLMLNLTLRKNDHQQCEPQIHENAKGLHERLLIGNLHKVDNVHFQGVAPAFHEVLAPGVEVQLGGSDLDPLQRSSSRSARELGH